MTAMLTKPRRVSRTPTNERSVIIKVDESYVRRRLEAKALLSGKTERFIFEYESIVAAIRGALRRKFPGIKFRVAHGYHHEYVEVAWRAELDESDVETVAAGALTTLLTIPARLLRP